MNDMPNIHEDDQELDIFQAVARFAQRLKEHAAEQQRLIEAMLAEIEGDNEQTQDGSE